LSPVLFYAVDSSNGSIICRGDINVRSTIIPVLKGFYLIVGIALCSVVNAQHSHGGGMPMAETYPADDSVLAEAPKMITLGFPEEMRMLKLVVYNADGKWVDIGLPYTPDLINHNFSFPIATQLPAAAYYLAKWSVVGSNDQLVSGQFKFAFGASAIPPSVTTESNRVLREEVLPSTGFRR
jgi:methionine-rich copper-binding protein CopC